MERVGVKHTIPGPVNLNHVVFSRNQINVGWNVILGPKGARCFVSISNFGDSGSKVGSLEKSDLEAVLRGIVSSTMGKLSSSTTANSPSLEGIATYNGVGSETILALGVTIAIF